MNRVQRFETSEEGCEYTANLIISRVKDFAPTSSKPFVLGLPTGSSPERVYAKLVAAYQSGVVSFKNVITFNMDEYVGIDPTNEQSYHYFMHHHFFDHVDIAPENINILDGKATNLEEECARYEAKIKAVGGIDFFMGGIGPNGHIAFNEIGSSKDSITRQISLEQSTIDANSRFFASADEVPKSALSVGIATVLAAREVLILAFGDAKAEAVYNSLKGPIGSECPGSFMRLHPNCLFVVDQKAALLL